MTESTHRSTASEDASHCQARAEVARPSACLIILALLSIVTVAVSAIFDLNQLVENNDPERSAWSMLSPQEERTARFTASLLLIGLNSIVLYGAVKMRKLQSYRWSLAACAISSTPCIAPCYLLAVPFGLWGILALGKPEVQRALRPDREQ